MAYRNGTYVAFHADGNNRPGKTDIDYYNLMKAWSAKTDDDFTIINSHDKAAAVRDSSLHATLRRSLHERLKNSKNMVLVIGETTRFDNDWIPFEIEQAIDRYEIPIIATYSIYEKPIRVPAAFSQYWPQALAMRINNGSAHVIHIPFKKAALNDAIGQFSHNKFPLGGGQGIYSNEAYRSFGISD
ncbi:TIR domain-containing protein [Comamonas odontotermitis]|uniref:TIR domain-containing protein n=1 Tax=Comamonas odontotermitis TaxID=379895 RepID=UPI00366CA89A